MILHAVEVLWTSENSYFISARRSTLTTGAAPEAPSNLEIGTQTSIGVGSRFPIA